MLSLCKIMKSCNGMLLSVLQPCGWTLHGGPETSTTATAVNTRTSTMTERLLPSPNRQTTATYYDDHGNRHDQLTTTKYIQIPPPSPPSSFLPFRTLPPQTLTPDDVFKHIISSISSQARGHGLHETSRFSPVALHVPDLMLVAVLRMSCEA